MSDSNNVDGRGHGDDDEPYTRVPALPSASEWRPTSAQIHAELEAIAYWLASLLPHDVGEIIAKGALEDLDENPGNLRTLSRLPNEVDRIRFFLTGPVRRSIDHYWQGELSDDAPTTGRPTQPRNTRALARLIEAMLSLTEAEQKAVVLCRVVGLSYDQAARLLSITRESVSRRLRTADERLRAHGLDPAANPGWPLEPGPGQERGVKPDATYPNTEEEE